MISISCNALALEVFISLIGFSRVYLVIKKVNGKFFAMKLILKSFIIKNQKQEIVKNERNIMVKSNN